jgi:hypothetical protein
MSLIETIDNELRRFSPSAIAENLLRLCQAEMRQQQDEIERLRTTLEIERGVSDHLHRLSEANCVAIERLRAELDPNRMKVAVCEYLLSLNEEDTFIPPTAIDWMGNGLVRAILAEKGAKP